jgi:hypothetical protein
MIWSIGLKARPRVRLSTSRAGSSRKPAGTESWVSYSSSRTYGMSCRVEESDEMGASTS